MDDIEAEAVLRVVRNPEGLSANRTVSTATSSARGCRHSFRITADEWDRLGIKPSGCFQIIPNLGGSSG